MARASRQMSDWSFDKLTPRGTPTSHLQGRTLERFSRTASRRPPAASLVVLGWSPLSLPYYRNAFGKDGPPIGTSVLRASVKGEF